MFDPKYGMNREDAILNTKLIGKFMEYKYISAYTDDSLVELANKFILSWDWLMPVYKKIKETYFDKREVIFKCHRDADIIGTYNAIIEFLTWWYDDEQEKLIFANQTIHDQQLKWINSPKNQWVQNKTKTNVDKN